MTTTGGDSSFSAMAPPIFNGENYDIWATRMEVYLDALDLWEAVEVYYEDEALPDNPTMAQIKSHKDRRIRKAKAKACLFAAVSSTIFPRIMALKSAKSIWDYLRAEYEGDDRIKGMQVLNLIRDFELQKMKESETIKEYSERLMNIANRVRLLGSSFNDSRIVEKILVTVPERFEATITTLENTKDLSKITLVELLNSLQAQEQRRLMREESPVEEALVANHEDDRRSKKKVIKKNQQSDSRIINKNKAGDYPPCNHCNKIGHPPFKCWKRPDAKCKKCNQLGHEAIICRSSNQKQDADAQVANEETEEEEDQLFVATCYSSKSSSESWLIDSGCTNHMTPDKELFNELKCSKVSRVRLGHGGFIRVKGVGTISITTPVGTKSISNVLYVPDLDQNLLSVGQLLKKGFKLLFEEDYCLIKDASGRDLFKVQMRGKTFSLDPVQEEQVAYLTKEDVAELWHKRLGHYHYPGLLKIQKSEMVKHMPEFEVNSTDCRACQYGKQSRLPFPKSNWRATRKLQLIHTDVGGPLKTPSLKGSRYYVIFIDDLTRMCWIYFLKFKSEVERIFWKFKAKVENESGCKIQILRSDNGKEYTSSQFNLYCEEEGIERQLTVPYTPEQNGVSERRNRYIMEMARCMMHEKNLPKKFWAEAANTAVFLQNRLPTKAVKNQTPFEAWYGYKPPVNFLRVFGCLCFTYVPQVKRDKLDKKAVSGIFIGYSDVSKGYKVFQPETETVTISRDVHFMENEEWKSEDSKFTTSTTNSSLEEIEDDVPVRGYRSISDIYQRCNVAVCEPADLQEALENPKWKHAMKEELFMIEKNQTWELVDKPQDRKVIGVKWVFRTKLNSDGSVNKLKARLVVKGYAQIFGVDYSDTFAPVARLETIRLLLAISAQLGWKVHQMDVKSAFLNGILEEEIYVEQPEGFLVKGEEEKVYKLRKALYGLKQAPRAWYSRIDDYLLELGFKKSSSESTLYVIQKSNEILIVSLYVDYILITGSSVKLIDEFKLDMKQAFEMSDLGLMTFFLGMEIKQGKDEVFICQQKYAKEILKKFKMDECKEMDTPMNQREKLSKDDGAEKVDESHYRSLIGCLMYLTATRFDILYAVNVLSRFMHGPSEVHLKAAKRVVRYIKGTINYGIKC